MSVYHNYFQLYWADQRFQTFDVNNTLYILLNEEIVGHILCILLATKQIFFINLGKKKKKKADVKDNRKTWKEKYLSILDGE